MLTEDIDLTDDDIARICGRPSQTFEDRLREDEHRMVLRLIYADVCK